MLIKSNLFMWLFHVKKSRSLVVLLIKGSTEIRNAGTSQMAQMVRAKTALFGAGAETIPSRSSLHTLPTTRRSDGS